MIYLVFFAIHYWSVALWRMGRNLFFAGMPFLVGAILLFIRNSGTDVEAYEQIIRYFANVGFTEALRHGMEPLFVALSLLLYVLTESEALALRAIGILYSGILWLFFVRGDRVEQLLLMLYIFPAFYLPYGMNAVRAGLGIAFFLLGWQAWRRGRRETAAFFWVLATLTHYSIFILIGFLILGELLFLTNIRRVVKWIPFLLASTLILALSIDWIQGKVELYTSHSQHVSFLSGLSSLSIMLCFIGFSLFLRKGVKVLFPHILWGFLAVLIWILGWITSSYAFLRIIDLMVFATPLLLIEWYHHRIRHVPAKWWLVALLAGLLEVGFFYRNALMDYGGAVTGTQTPFLPFQILDLEALWSELF